MIDTGDIDVVLGLDVGKSEHHATAVTPVGEYAWRWGPVGRIDCGTRYDPESQG
ncbi:MULTISPECIES: hypothetical protein [Streptomyces]|uniref:hypothetical protein n=1 Tax=Streptomyces TaxID=1883 RepID=UPI00145E8805|nr:MULTISPECIES: hypothetical protein [unclassified Streptomyces]